MSRFAVKRSLKQLYIEKHALEYFIAQKKIMGQYEEMTVRQASELRSEEALLIEIMSNIQIAEAVVKRDIAEL